MTERVLFSSFPGYGHLNPLLPLASAYRDAGWEVLVVTGPDMCAQVERHGFEVRALGCSQVGTESAFLAAHPEYPSMSPTDQVLAVIAGLFIEIAARSRIDETVALVESWRPDVVVHDVAEFAAPVAAARLGVPHVAHGVTIPGPDRHLLEGISEAAEELCRHAGVTGDLEELLGGIYLDICPPSLAMGGDNPFAEVIPLRPVVPAAGGGPGLELGDLPYERTVHVTLGTVVNSTAGLLETIVSGARALEVNVVVTVGPDRDPAGLGPQPRSVIVERYLPYSLLLPRCDAVISHAGAGTLLASLDNGLPSVLVPVGPEQVLNAIAATRAGVASLLVPGGLTEETVRGELGRVLGAAGFTERARAVQAEISAMPLPEQVLERLPVNRP